jgi:cysteine desulfurase
MGEAFEIGERDRESDVARIGALRERLWQGLNAIGGVELNGSATERVSGVLNVCFHNVEGESLRFALRDLAVSSGSACASGSDEASYVLRALGRSDQMAQSSIRFSLGRFTTEDDVDRAIASVTREVNRLRALSPIAAQST